MPMMEEDWELLTTFFPTDWEALGKQENALKGLRKNKSAEDFLRTLLIHVGCGHSLRETVVRAEMAGLGQMSDVALLKRLRKSKEWLHMLCRRLLEERLGPASGPNAGDTAMYLLDGTLVSEPGRTGSQWRIHYSMRWPDLTCDFFKLTPVEGKGNGESLARFPVTPGNHYIADRGYCTAAGIRHIASGGGFVAVRIIPGCIRFHTPEGQVLPLLDELRKLDRPNEVTQWHVAAGGATGDLATPGRLCVLRKTETLIHEAHLKLRRKASKNGVEIRPETLEYAKFIMVFTTFDEGRFPAATVLEWYRIRWQVELVFKRFKQIASLGHLPKHDAESSQAWLYGKLFVALLTEKMLAHAQSFSPWGYDLAPNP